MPVPICLVLHSDVDAMNARLSEIVEIGFSPVYVFVDGVSFHDSEHIKSKNETIRLEISRLKGQGAIKEIFLSLQNLGVGAGLLCATDWFFSLEDFGIILEDDCQICAGADVFAKKVHLELAEDDMFGGFCLTKYSLDLNQGDSYRPHGTSFFQSWGWGSSARIWSEFRSTDLSQVTKAKLFKRLAFLPVMQRIILTHILWKEFSLVRNGEKNLWAVLFTVFLIQKQFRLALPADNLVLHLPRSHAANVTQMPRWYRSMVIIDRPKPNLNVSLSIQESYEQMLARNVFGASFSRLCISFLLRLPWLSVWRLRIKLWMRG